MARLMDRLTGLQPSRDIWLRGLTAGRAPHANLFVGLPGIGKKSFALAIAQQILCERATHQACGECGSCLRVEQNQSESLLVVGPDASKVSGTIPVETARDILQFLQLRSISSRGRIVVIDDVHQMNAQGANLLLKTLEEPPENTWFFLITSQPQSLLSTIRSRCQTLKFSPLSQNQVQELTGCSPWVASSSRGSVQTAQLLQDEAFTELRNLAWQSFADLLEGKGQTEYLADTVKDRKQAEWVLQFWLQFVRDARVTPLDERAVIHSDMRRISVASGRLDKVFAFILQALEDVRGNVDRTLIFENAYMNW